MASLLEKIQSDALQRLKPSSGRTPLTLTQYRNGFSSSSRTDSRCCTAPGPVAVKYAGFELVFSDIPDLPLIRISQSRLSPQAKGISPMALVALGGTGGRS